MPRESLALSTALTTATLPFISSVPQSAVTIANSPASTSRRTREGSLVSPVLRSGTLQDSPIMEDTESHPQSQFTDQNALCLEPTAIDHEALSNNPMPPNSVLLPHPRWTSHWPLNAQQIYHAQKIGLIPAPPYISPERLKNQSKADPMVKALTVWQILWLAIQILARSRQSPPLSITLIEVTVLAFAATAITTYILLWHKPQDVKVPHYIDALRPITRKDVAELAAQAPWSTMKVYEFWLHGIAVRAMGDGVFPTPKGIKLPKLSDLNPLRLFKRIGRWFRQRKQPVDDSESKESKPADSASASNKDEEDIYMDPIPIGIGIGGATFGAVHICASSFYFPTPIEQLLWRLSCAILIGLPMLMVSIYSGIMHYTQRQGKDREDSKVNLVLTRFGRGLIPVYLVARLFLFVETFRSLAFSKPDAFKEVEWPSAIPHYM